MAKGDDKKIKAQGQQAAADYKAQQGPVVNNMAYNYGRATETNYNDYNDIMNRYRDLGGSGGSSGGGGGGYATVGAGSVTAGKLGPLERVQAQKLGPLQNVSAQALNPWERVSAEKLGELQKATAAGNDPFKSYEGYTEFSKSGGYSPEDIANMRARGTSPVRAAYANAERNIGQQRALQGGYSPNAIATQAKMAREQGQGMADAMQNVEAGLAEARNKGRLAGLGGMSDIEGQRYQGGIQQDIFNVGQANQGRQFDIDAALRAGMFNSQQGLQANQFDVTNRLNADQYNANQAFQGQQFDIGNQLQGDMYNSGQAFQGQQFDIGNQLNADQFNAQQGLQAGMFNAGASNQQSAMDYENELAKLRGMTSLYGTTPGMSEMFGNQLINTMGQGANYDLGMMGRQTEAAGLPSTTQQVLNNVQQGAGIAGGAMSAWDDWKKNQQQPYQAPQYTDFGY